MSATYELTWPDHKTSVVTVAVNERGFAQVTIAGTSIGLSTLHDYRTEDAVAIELRYLAQKLHFQVVKVKQGG